MLVIDPEECIDCGICIPECPVSAIVPEEDVPAGQTPFVSWNRELARDAPPVTRSKAPLPDAKRWSKVPGKQLLLERSTTSGLPRVLEALGKYANPLEKMPKSELADGLKSPDPLIRYAIASRPDFAVSRVQLEQGLRDPNEHIRRLYGWLGSGHRSRKELLLMLDDPAQSLRMMAVQSLKPPLDSRVVHRILDDQDVSIRLALIENASFQPTLAHFRKVLARGSEREVRTILRKLRPELVSSTLAHPEAYVRAAGFEFESVALTRKQFEAGLRDASPTVRYAVVRRGDFSPDVQTFLRMLADSSSEVVKALCAKASPEWASAALAQCDAALRPSLAAWLETLPAEWIVTSLAEDLEDVCKVVLERGDFTLTRQTAGLGLRSKHESVRLKSLLKWGVNRLSGKQIEACLTDASHRIRALVAGSAIALSADQVERALLDRSSKVRLAVARRADFQPTAQQLKRGLRDTSMSVCSEFAGRFKLRADKKVGRVQRDLRGVLKELSSISTWTARKHQLRAEMMKLLEADGYLIFSTDHRHAWFTSIGENGEFDFPTNKRGALSVMRGQRAHIVCIGQDRFSTVRFAAKAVGPK
jgi:ferredoxin